MRVALDVPPGTAMPNLGDTHAPELIGYDRMCALPEPAGAAA